MKSAYSRKKPGGVLLALFLLFGIAIISSTTAQAQWPWGNGQNRSDRNRDERIRRERERQRNRDDRYRRDRNTGVYDPYGRNDTYRRNNGGYGNVYGGYSNVYQVARNQGYSDGLSTGSADAQRGQSYNPQRSHYYKDGSDGYNSSYGNRGQYKQAFREAFLQGYREGYQRYGYNRGRNNNGRQTNGSWFPW
jgi:hypothetical protein